MLPCTSPPAPVALPRSLGSVSLIGTSIPVSASIPVYPKIHDDPETYVADQLILISSDMTQAKHLAQLMTQYQVRVIRRRKLTDLNFVLSTFRLSKSSAKQTSVKQLLENIRVNHPQVLIAPNYYFYPQSTPTARELNNRNDVFKKINKPQGEACGDNLNVGILDGPINTDHTSLTAQKIIQENFYAKGEKLASNSQKTKKMLATTESLILGLNWLASKKVNVINLSLGGKRNLLLELALKRVIEKKSSSRRRRAMAAQLVTAAVSLLVQQQRPVNTLFEQALDLGAVGKDPVFGFGLLQFSDCSG